MAEPATHRPLSDAEMTAALEGVHEGGPIQARAIHEPLNGMGDLHQVSGRYAANDEPTTPHLAQRVPQPATNRYAGVSHGPTPFRT
jgi:hypothetical protein